MNKFFKNKDQNFLELFKGGSSALILKILGMGASYIAMLFITRFYGAEEWGIYTVGLTFLNIVILIPVFGFDNALVRVISELRLFNDKKGIINVFYKTLVFSTILSIVLILLLSFISNTINLVFLNKIGLEPNILKLVLIAIIPFAFLKLIAAVFQSFKKIIEFMMFKTSLLNIIFLLLLIVFYYLKVTVIVFEIYVIAIGISLVFGVGFLFKFLTEQSQNNELKVQSYNIKKLISLSFPMLLSSSFGLFMGWSDILMITYFSSTLDAGIYSSALKLASIALISLEAVNSISTPKFVEFYVERDFQGLERTIKKATSMMFYTSAPILLILILFSKMILGFLGAEFVSGYNALILLCLARFINSISGSVGYLMQMTNNQKIYQNVMFTALIINIILNLILIPNFGINGAAIASACSMIFWNLCLVFLIKQKFDFWTIYIPFLSKIN